MPGIGVGISRLIKSGIVDPLANMILWLDATVGKTGNPISAWADQSGQGNNASQGTASARPTDNTSYVSFDGNDLMDCGNGDFNIRDKLTIETRVNLTTNTGWQVMVSKWNSPTGGYLHYLEGTGTKLRFSALISKDPTAGVATSINSTTTVTQSGIKTLKSTMECTRKFTGKQFLFDGEVASILKVGGEYWMYYDRYTGSAYNVYKRVGTDLLTWGSETQVLANHIYGRVFYDSDASIYRMFTNDAPAGVADLSAVEMWTSNDGNSWSLVGDVLTLGAGGSFDDFQVDNCSWIKRGGVHYLYYEGWAGASDSVIGYATSNDGVNYTKQGIAINKGSGEAFDKTICVDPATIYEYSSGNYIMFYTGLNLTYSKTMMGYATSTDLVTWTKFSGNPCYYDTGESYEVSTYGSIEPCIFVEDGKYHMVYRSKSAIPFGLAYCYWYQDQNTGLPIAGNEKVEGKIYVDGVLENSFSFTSPDVRSIDYILPSGNNLFVGGRSGLTPMIGDVYYFKVWNEIV